MGIGINIVQPDPHTQVGQGLGNPSMFAFTGRPCQKPVWYLISTPYALVSWEITSNSRTPAAASRSASSSTSFTGRLRNLPRIEGMMQKLQL